MILTEKYRNDALSLGDFAPFGGSRHIGWKSPSNIALIKYWGKAENQLPRNPSISFALHSSFTETAIEYSMKRVDNPALSFAFEGNSQPGFEARIRKTIDDLLPYLPFLNQLDLKIESVNSFPHSSGIASSASAMSALALCFVSIERQIYGTLSDQEDFLGKASFIARLGSGSASRSLFGQFSVWGYDPEITGSTDEKAVPITVNKENELTKLGDAVMIVNSKPKKVSSTAGHGLMNDHPFAKARYLQARANLQDLIVAINRNDQHEFIRIVENEALMLHSLMMSSSNGFTLLKPNTWNIIEKIRAFREERGLFLAFTLDAGPNVHIIYKLEDREKILDFINNTLISFCEEGYWIDDRIGTGPLELN